MPKSIFITTVEKELSAQLSDLLWELDNLKPEDDCHIYIYSLGWSMWQFMILLRRLNLMVKNGFNITLHLSYVASAALFLAWLFQWKVETEYDCEWVAHIWAIDFWPVHGTTIRTNDPMDRQRFEYFSKEPQYVFPFLTDEEKTRYLNGEDVWINPVRMREIFHNRTNPCSIDSSMHWFSSVLN